MDLPNSPSSSFLLSSQSDSSFSDRRKRQHTWPSPCWTAEPSFRIKEDDYRNRKTGFSTLNQAYDDSNRAPHHTTGYPSPSSERNRNVPLPNDEGHEDEDEYCQRMNHVCHVPVSQDAFPIPHDHDLHLPLDCDLPLSPPPTHLTVPHALPEPCFEADCHALDQGIVEREMNTATPTQLSASPQPPEDRQDTLDLLTPLSPPWSFGLEERSSAPTVPEESALLSHPAPYARTWGHSYVRGPLEHAFVHEQDDDGDIRSLPLSPSFTTSPSTSHSHIYMDEDESTEHGASSQMYPGSLYDPQGSPSVPSLYGDDSEISGTDSSIHTPPQLFSDLPSRASTWPPFGESVDGPLGHTYYGSFDDYDTDKVDSYDDYHTCNADDDAIMASPKPFCSELPELYLAGPSHLSPPAMMSSGPGLAPEDLDMPPPSPSPSRRTLALCADLPEESDFPMPLSPCSPSRRTFHELPEVDTADEPPQADMQSPRPSQRLLSLPGAETDDDLIAADCSYDVEPPPMAMDGPSLGLFMPVATASADALIPSTRSPSPELEPELEFPAEAEARADPDELARLVGLRRRLWFAERNAKRTETSHVEEAQRIAADLRVSPPVPGALGDDTFAPAVQADRDPMSGVRRALQVAEHRRAEARRVRKREKERGKEVQALLRLKLLEETAAGEAVPIRRDGRGKVIISSMAQLVARMVFKRHDALRPLSRNPATAYTPSPLSSVALSADEDAQG